MKQNIIYTSHIIIYNTLIGPIGVFAQSENRIIYTYKSGIGNENQLESIFIRVNTIMDTSGPKDVTIITEEGTPQIIGRITVEEGEVGREIARNFWINNPKSNMRIISIIIGNFELNLSPAPKIDKMEVYDINVGEDVSFTGERLNQGTIEISGEGESFYTQDSNRFTATMNGTTGYKNITLKTTDQYTNTTQSAVYPNAFKLLGNMPQLGEKLEIIPKMGAKESIAYIKADGNFTIKDGEAQHSVFS